jgi:hypothetical protein
LPSFSTPVIPGGESHWLPLVTVDDTAEFIARVATWPGADQQAFTLLDPKGPRMPELMRMLARELGLRPPSRSLPMAWIKNALRFGGGALLGMPAAAMDFITPREFPVAATREAHAAPAGGFRRERVGRLAALVQPGTGTPWVILHGLFSNAGELGPWPKCCREPRSGCWTCPALAARHSTMHQTCWRGKWRPPWRRWRRSPDRCGWLEQVAELYLLQPPLRRPQASWLTAAGAGSGRLLAWGLGLGHRYSLLARLSARTGGFAGQAEMPAGYRARIVADMRSPWVRRSHAAALVWAARGHRGIDLGTLPPIPVRLVWGTRDPACPGTWGEAAVSLHAGVTLTRVPRAHQFPLSAPDETAAILMKLSRR